MFLKICLVLFAYLLGSVPWGLVIAKMTKGIDPRTAGSKSTGATNVSRLCGFGYGVATLACDLGKGALPVFLAVSYSNDVFFISLTALAAVLGHVFSCFLKFKGGKAVATTIGVFLPLAFYPLLAAAFLCVVLIWLSGFVSLGSLTLVTSLPLFLAFSGGKDFVPLAIFLACIVFFKHRENIARLHAGVEKPWLKSRQKPEDKES
ncbi:MAG: glycerol-3-phosphate 1-O-acyltransferase PlsY [Desulfovibrionaceae bacterium]|nr:glycerol-3-phosphate 1-O-acyltransferase PlsY [Desulfovibrionaceae bacterium]